MTTLSDHVAIISGGLGGIGRACAVELAQQGADIADIAAEELQDNDQLEPFRVEMQGQGRQFRFDASDPSDASRRWTVACLCDLENQQMTGTVSQCDGGISLISAMEKDNA
jgi:NAD(P)-dependent dehydrogenase (short-subunit alcohol dehydrogenase family)